jgi:hypothetical protein
MESESKMSDVNHLASMVLEKRKRDCNEGEMESEPVFPASKSVKVEHEHRVARCTGIIPCEPLPRATAAFL